MTTIETGHDDRPVRVVEVGGERVVRKQYFAADGAAVFADMRALWASSFGASRTPPAIPEPLGYDDATRSLDMRWVDGTPLGQRNDLGATPHAIAPLAALLAELHDSSATFGRRRNATKLVRSIVRKLTARPERTGLLGALSACRPAGERLVASHGDFAPRNVLVTTTGLCVIDFDRLQMAGAGRDLAYLGAWCWATTLTAHGERAASWVLAAELERSYLEHRPFAASEIVRSRAFHRAAALVRIAMGWSTMQSDGALRTRVLDEAVRQLA